MTIEKAGGATLDAVQTQLVTISKEERLVELYEMEDGIMALEEEADQLRHKHNAIRNEIKSRKKEKRDLMDLIGRGQETFVQVPITDESDQDEESDKPTDDELAAFDDPPPAEEPTSDPDPKNEDLELRDLQARFDDAIKCGEREAADSLLVRIDERKAVLKARSESNNSEDASADTDSGNEAEKVSDIMSRKMRKKGGKK